MYKICLVHVCICMRVRADLCVHAYMTSEFSGKPYCAPSLSPDHSTITIEYGSTTSIVEANYQGGYTKNITCCKKSSGVDLNHFSMKPNL